MRTLEKSEEKIQKICDLLKRETLEPAEKEASEIVEEAKKKAAKILAQGQHQAEEMIKEAKKNIEQQWSVFHSSLSQGARQTLETLRQAIEEKFFNEEIPALLQKEIAEPKVIAAFLRAILLGIEKEGISGDLQAFIPSKVSKEAVIACLSREILEKFEGQTLEIGDFAGGALLKVKKHKMVLDLTDRALKELLANTIRKDFREALFAV